MLCVFVCVCGGGVLVLAFRSSISDTEDFQLTKFDQSKPVKVFFHHKLIIILY